MRIVTIVVTYNGEQYISKCLQSLRDSTVKTEVVVIDNASSDTTVKLIRQQFPECILYSQDQNLGFGAANNIGLRYAVQSDVDYVFLLNQDAYVEPETIGYLIPILEKNSEIGILSPMHFYDKGISERFFTMFLEAGKSKYAAMNGLQQVDFVDAAIWLIPVNVVKKVGLFSPLFYHYGEDDNFCDRVLYFGYQICIALQVNAYHQSKQTITFPRGQLFYLIKRFRLKSLIYLADPNKPLGSECKNLIQEIFAAPVAGKLKGFIYRNIVFIMVVIYLIFNGVKAQCYKKLSRSEGAFLN